MTNDQTILIALYALIFTPLIIFLLYLWVEQWIIYRQEEEKKRK